MPRYFSGGFVPESPDPEHWVFNEHRPMVPELSVPSHVATDTGLLDSKGQPIMRAPNPVGFGKDGEW